MRASQTQDKFIVRLPDGMREQISEAAAANKRSMTAEIVARLALSFEQQPSLPVSFLEANQLASEIENLRMSIRAEESERKALQNKVRDMELRLKAVEAGQ